MINVSLSTGHIHHPAPPLVPGECELVRHWLSVSLYCTGGYHGNRPVRICDHPALSDCGGTPDRWAGESVCCVAGYTDT